MQVEINGLYHFTKKAQVPIKISNEIGNEHASKTHYFLQKLLSAADQNEKRQKGGYRYSGENKHFAAYLPMLVGSFAYETLQKNSSHCLPLHQQIDTSDHLAVIL